MTNQPDVIVVGAGVMGCGTAYWLSKAGYKILVLEQEAIACGASGMAAAMLEAVGHGAQLSTHDPLTAFARAGFHLHADRFPLIGAVPGWPGVYMVAGHFRSGMLLSTISTRCIADLVIDGKSSVPLDVFDPARFTPGPS